MSKKAIDCILDFINKYRAVSFSALRMNFPHISDETIFTDTTRLCKRRLISYEKKKRDLSSTVYFSETFNREHTKTVFDNTENGYQTALTVIPAYMVWDLSPSALVSAMDYTRQKGFGIEGKVYMMCFEEDSKAISDILNIDRRMAKHFAVCDLPYHEVIRYINGENERIE